MSSTSLYITYLGKEGPFLKIWGQLDKNTPIAIDKALADATISFNNGHHIPPSIHFFTLGNLCCAKFSDDCYYRAKITNTDHLVDGYVEVLFIDYGNTDNVQCNNVRTMAPFSKEFINIIPQAKEFYLMNVTHNGTDWDPAVLEQIMQTIRYVDVAIADVIQIGSNYLIKLIQNDQEISSMLKNAGFGVDVPTHIQQTLIHKNLIQKMQEPQVRQSRQPQQQLPSPSTVPPNSPYNMQQQQVVRPTILTFKSTPLEANSEHEIYVSYVTDGPLLFSIQLKKTEENLRAIMNEVNTVALQPFADTPAPSTMCLAKSVEDGYICRGVVTNMVDGEYKIYYVDFGNTEMRSIDFIYEIPYKFIIPKLMATRFALDGFDKAVVSVHMKVAFKEFVENRLLNMKVKSRCIKTGLPLCDIWDEKGIQAIDVVKQAAFDAYADPIQVSKGSAQPVRVTSVYSCNRFYIQLKGKDDEVQAMVTFMQQSCPIRKPLDKDEVYPGRPCAAQLATDNKWHRAIITEAFTNGTVKIFFIDVGIEDTVHSCNLKKAHYDQITTLRPQALQCSLNGYQNMPPDKERDTFLTEILLKHEFTAKVVDVLGSLVLVDMIDGKNYNVASLLLEKLANSRSQISPLLIQDSNKIELKKRSPKALPEKKSYNREQNSSFVPRESNERPRTCNRDEGFMSRNRDNTGNQEDGFISRDRNRGGDSFRSGNRDGGNTGGYQNKKFGRNNSGTDSSSEKDISPDKTKGFSRQNKPNERVNNYGDSNANRYSRTNPRDGIPPTGKHNRISSKASDSGSDNWDGSCKRDSKPTNANPYRREYQPDGASDKLNSNKSSKFQSFQTPPAEDNVVLASVDAQFQTQMLLGNRKNVSICWFHSPDSFFIQLEDTKNDLATMLKSLQFTYKKKRTITAVVNQAVIAQYPADNAYYRASVVEVASGKCRVQYVDFGNTSVTTKVFAIEEQHMVLPAQTVRCQLSGIKPVGNEWANANLMQKHFDADVFACEFVVKLEDRYEVILTNNTRNIADLLVADNLAVRIITLELPLLLCQEIKVLVKSVNSLSDFIIEVEPNVKVQCSLHNLTDATATYEASFKELVGLFVIAFFDNVEGNRAEVTLYDTCGMKLKLIEPDEGALESISPLCALPVFLSTVGGFVSHATNTSVFIQPSKYTTYVVQLLDSMFSMYNGVENTEPVAPEEGFECAVLSPDENWYRGKITSVEGDNVTVHYVDYGNNETVSISSLRILDGSLYDPHELSIEIRIDKANESLVETELILNVAYVDDGWAAVEKDLKPEVKEVKSAVVTPVQEQAVVQEECAAQVGEPTEAAYESNAIPITVSHIETPNMFYVQLAQDLEAIDALQANLLAQIDTLAYTEPSVDMLCAALFNENQEWYRAEVLAIQGDKVEVRFVDYGNCNNVDCSQTKVKLLPSDLQSLERYARPCSLYITPTSSETNNWSAEACARFEELAYIDGICAEIIEQTEDITYIHIYHNDVNLAELLVNESYAFKMGVESAAVDCTALPPPNLTPATAHQSVAPSSVELPGIAVQVSHIDSPGQFYVQLATDLDAIDTLQTNLQTQVKQLVDVEAATAGVLCAAMYSANQEWYRAQVLDTDDDITTVRFVDYGNTDVLDNKQTKVKSLSSELLTLEQYARRCSLYVTPSIESSDWSQEACARFEELAYVENVRAEIIEQDDKTTFVNLFANNINVAEVLVSEKHGQPMLFETAAAYPSGFISHVNSPSEFWIQLENACGDLERIADQLERDAATFGALNDMSPGTLCAAVFPDDDNWYRARILSNTVAGLEVLFIDYGNSCTCTNLRELPEDLVMTPALAQKCCLQKPNGVLQWSPAATETFKKIAADGRTIFVVHKIVPGETTIVQLYLDDEDIGRHLLPITVEGCVSHYEKLDSFWIRKTADLSKLEKWTVMLPNAKNWSKAVDIEKVVAAFSETDDAWHRAKVNEKIEGKEEYAVLLIDSGANIRTCDIRAWSEDSVDDFNPLATKCKLQPLPGFKWTTESEAQFQTINNIGNTIFHVEFLNDEVVQLYHEMQDVRNCLDCIKSTPITSLQTTPSKKSEDLQKVDANADNQEEIIAVELNNDCVINTQTTSSDITEIINELVDNSVQNSSNIDESLPDKPEVEVVPEHIEVSSSAEMNCIVNELVQNSVKSSEESTQSVETDNYNSAVEEIVDELLHNSVKSPRISALDKLEADQSIADNDTLHVKEILVQNAVVSPVKLITEADNINNTSNDANVTDAKGIADEPMQNSAENLKICLGGEPLLTEPANQEANVTSILEEIVTKSTEDLATQNSEVVSKVLTEMSDIVEEIVDNSTKSVQELSVENTNITEVTTDKAVFKISDKKFVLSDIDIEKGGLGDSLESSKSTKDSGITLTTELIKAADGHILTETCTENLNVNTDIQTVSSDIINSIVDRLD